MDATHYLRIARQQWLLIVVCAVAGSVAGALIAFTQAPTYAAHAQLFVSTSGAGNDVSQAYEGGLFSQQRVKSYAEIVDSPDVARAVIERLDVPYAASKLRSQIRASVPEDTVLINYVVNDTSAERARELSDAVGIEFARLVNRLETPQGKEHSPVKVSVTKRADLPTAPVSPRPALDIGLGLLVGLGIGVAGAALRESLDNSVGTKHDAGALTGSPVLAAIGEDSEADTDPLAMCGDGFSVRAEAYRQLRTNIRFLNVDKRPRSLLVTSSVAEEGKTITATNLAIALAEAGEHVVLVDADLRRPTVSELLGLPYGAGLTNVLLGDVELGNALQLWRSDLRLDVLTSGAIPPNPSELVGSQRMANVLAALTEAADVVVVDSPPLLPVTDAAVLAQLSGGAILVTRFGSTRVEQLRAAAAALRNVDAPILGVVLSRVPRRATAGGYHSYGYAYRPGARVDMGTQQLPSRRAHRAKHGTGELAPPTSEQIARTAR